MFFALPLGDARSAVNNYVADQQSEKTDWQLKVSSCVIIIAVMLFYAPSLQKLRAQLQSLQNEVHYCLPQLLCA